MPTQDIFFHIGQVDDDKRWLQVPYRCTVRDVKAVTAVGTHCKNIAFTVKKGDDTIGTLTVPNTTAMESAGVATGGYVPDNTNGNMVLSAGDVLEFATADGNAVLEMFIELDPFGRKG
jgi:hypothetical protein